MRPYCFPLHLLAFDSHAREWKRGVSAARFPSLAKSSIPTEYLHSSRRTSFAMTLIANQFNLLLSAILH